MNRESGRCLVLAVMLAAGCVVPLVPLSAQPKPDLKLELKGEKKPSRGSLGEFRISLDNQMLDLDGPVERPPLQERPENRFTSASDEARKSPNPPLVLKGSRAADGPVLLSSDRPEPGLGQTRRVVSQDIGSTVTLTAGYIEGRDPSNPSDARAFGAMTRLGRWSVYGEFAREDTSRLTLDLRNGGAGVIPVRPLLNRDGLPGGGLALRDARLSLPSTDLPDASGNGLDRYYLEAIYSFRPSVQGKVSYQRSLLDATTRRDDLQLEGMVETGRDKFLKAGYFLLSFGLGATLSILRYLLVAGLAILCVHLAVHFRIILPLRQFSEVSESVVDGDPNPDLASLQAFELEDVQESFVRMISSLLESREAIENYMKTISDINRQLESKVDSLSVLYSAGRAMGATLSVDTLIRTFLSLLMERLHLSGAAIMLYNDKNDMVTVKDLLGFSPELFAKLRFYSDHKIIVNLFSGEGFWEPDDAAHNLMTAEFETDAVRSIRLIHPMRIKDHFVGVIVLGERKDRSRFGEADRQLIQALVGLATTAINNAMLYERSESTKNELDRKVFNLMTLQQSGKVLSSTLNIEDLLRISIDMFLETVWANKGILMLHDDETMKLEIKAYKGLSDAELAEVKVDPNEDAALATLQREKRPVLAHELSGKKPIMTSYTTMGSQKPLFFAVYVPLLKEGELYGVVKVGLKINGESFTENDLEFFSTLGSQAVIAFENARLYSLAITDSITKLYVHRYFQLRLDEEVKRSRRYNSALSLLMCDIDHFKLVNDTYGHQQGDLILKEISSILRRNIRATDIAARYGGEEFVIILPETTQADARIVAERIRRDVAKFEFPSVAAGMPPIRKTISIGVAGFPINANDKDELIQKADSSMYQAKGSGRNRVVMCGIDLPEETAGK